MTDDSAGAEVETFTRPYSDPEMGDAAGRQWLTFVEALDELLRLSGYGRDRAVQWLAKKGAAREIPVRCLAHHLPAQHPDHRPRLPRYLREFEDRYSPAHDFVSISQWLEWHPKEISEPWVQAHSEWRKAEFDALIEPFAVAAGKSRKGVGGPKPNDEWFGVMVEVGAWLANETGPHKPADVAGFIATRFVARGLEEPGKTERFRRANQALGAFRGWQTSGR